jgi:predicted deacetylase
MHWRDSLQARLIALQPGSVCALDESARLLAGAALPGVPVRMHDELQNASCALALAIDALNGLDAQRAQHLISQTRLYAAPRILIAAQLDCALDEAAFRALGFMQLDTDATENIGLYYFDIETYKMVPDWLNARYWAHPERWEP